MDKKCPFKNAIKTLIGKDIHYVIYIEYQNNIPSTVFTIHFITTSDKPYWRLYSWDFYKNNDDKNDLIFYNSGSGGDERSIYASHWIDGYVGQYWIAEKVKLKGRVINGKKVDLKRIKQYNCSSVNPFKVSNMVYNIEYCDRCGYYSYETCWEHKYESKDKSDCYVLRYIDDESICE